MTGTSNFCVPRLIAWELTRRCNLRCAHCRACAGADGAVTNGEEVRSSELSFDEAKRVVDDMATLGQLILILTGGEPLMCPYLFELVAYAREKGLKPVIGTNATLIDDAVAARIAAAGISRVSVSVDFPTAADHDRFRGVPGAFDAALGGVRALRRAGVEVQVNTTVTRLNRHLLGEIHDLAAGLDVQALHPFLLVPAGRGADLADVELGAAECEETLRWVCEKQKVSPLEFKPTDAPQYQRIVRQDRTGDASGGRVSRPSGRGCLAGTGFAFIGHCGDVQPCGYFDLKLGNVRKTPFTQIWRESPVLDDLRHPERLKGKCGICEYKGVCGGCRARAFAKKGDYLAEEPTCIHVPERELLDLLQSDFPLVARPYAALGEKVGADEETCFRRVRALKAAGIVRRVGASFDSRRLGHVSTLVAAQVSADRLDAVAAYVNAFPQVTHDYVRADAFNLWFTVIAKDAAEVEKIVGAVRREKGVTHVVELPATKTYKLRAVFGGRTGETPVPPNGGGASGERAGRPFGLDVLVRAFQDDILPRGLSPFAPDELRQLQALVADGTIRRFGAFVDHREVGLTSNALVAWRIPDGSADAVGAAFAAEACVSHCYRRRVPDGWTGDLFTMVHARSPEELRMSCRRLGEVAEAVLGKKAEHRVFETVRECKKVSMRYFIA